MSDQFLAEIRIFACDFAPFGWAYCNGQILSISQNAALFSLLGTNYGGNGTSNFALPNLQGYVPMGWGQGPGLSPRDIGETGGQETATLIASELPSHTHFVACSSSAADQTSPSANNIAVPPGQRGQKSFATTVGASPQFAATAIQPTGQSFSHNNMPPYLTVNFCIALTGTYPSRG